MRLTFVYDVYCTLGRRRNDVSVATDNAIRRTLAGLISDETHNVSSGDENLLCAQIFITYQLNYFMRMNKRMNK
jgi:hypothetical protein